MKCPFFLRLLGFAMSCFIAAGAYADYLVSGRTDLDVGAVLRYDDEGTLIATMGEGLLREPSGLLFDLSGRLLVADLGLGTVETFQRDGTYLGTFAAGLNLPIALMQLDDQTIIVAEYDSGLIRRYAADGTDLGLFANTGFTRQYQFARNPLTGNVHVAGYQEKVVWTYGQDGSDQGAFSDENSGMLNSPGGLAFRPDGSLFVNETQAAHIKLLDSSGNFLQVFSDQGVVNPAFLTIDGNSDVLLANYDGANIHRYAPDGTDLGNWIDVKNPYHIVYADPLRQDLVPEDYTVVRGVELGTHDPSKIQLGNDANPAVVEQRGQPTPTLPNTELRATMTVPAGSVRQADLHVRLQGNPAPLSTARSEVLLRNWNTGLFEVVYTENPMADTAFRAITVSLDATQRANYIRSSDGAVEVSTRIFQVAPLSPAWRMRVSLLQLSITR